MSSETQVHIERFACRFNLPAGNPYATAARLENIARHAVAPVCAGLIAALPDDADAVYRIRRLQLSLWLDVQAVSDAEIAQTWGALLERAIRTALTRGNARNVIRFDSPRHFITCFLRDLLNGCAWGQWYYEEFHVLRSLPPHVIALNLLAPRPDWIAPVLLDLDEDARLIARWTARDIDRLWRALAAPPGLDLPLPDLSGGAVAVPFAALELPALHVDSNQVAALLSLWTHAPHSTEPSADARARDKLRLWLALAATAAPHLRDPRLLGLINALVDLVALVRTEPDIAHLLAMQTPLYPALTARIHASALADMLDWLTPAEPRQVAEMVESVLRRVSPGVRVESGDGRTESQTPADTSEAVQEPSPPLVLVSEVGGVFLLLPALVELGIWDLWSERDHARDYLFAVALKALGGERAPLLLGDAALTTFAGLAVPPTADARLPLELDTSLDWTVEGAAARFFSPEERAASADEAELPYFRLGQRLGFPWLTPTLDRALAQVTVLALRRTVARLPGFGRSSAQYTAQQFIAQPASLRVTGDLIDVRLSGGALAVVLRLAGLPWTVSAAWLAQPVRLSL